MSSTADTQAVPQALAAESGARLTITADVATGVAGAGFLYTDVWLSINRMHTIKAVMVATLGARP